MAPPDIFRFFDCELDCSLYELRRAGEPVKLAPKAFDLLLYMVEHRERVVAKGELLDRVWPDEVVTEAVLPTHVTALRKALGDGRSDPRAIQTVHGRGYRFIASVSRPDEDAAPHGAPERPKFVGRTRALGRLHQALDDALAGRGRVALIAGEPGIGKTRTAEEICRLAAERGATVYEGRCFEGEGAPAFWPWLQILRAATSRGSPDALHDQLGSGASDVAHLVPELRERLPDVPAAQELDSDRARFRLFDSVAGFLRNASRESPLVLLLDDLHWADEPTLRLLEFCADQLRSTRILILGAYRDVELRRQHPLGQSLGELAREPHFERILLRGLAEEEVAEFLGGALAREPEQRLVDAVFEMTEGNPFFIHETARLLLAEGRARGARTPVEIKLPQGVREAIGRRLSALSPECNRVLTLAAVIGASFGLSTLEALDGTSREKLLELLDEAVEARIIQDRRAASRDDALPLGHYAFCHVLVRETLYGELAAPQRTQLHRAVGQALEAVFGASEAHLAEVAHHFFEAAPGGDISRAIDASVRAAEHALGLLAYEDAASHYDRALQVADLGTDDATRCELLLGAGFSLLRSDRVEEARARYRSAAAAARRLDRGDLLARAALGIGGWPPVSGPEATFVNPEFRALVEEAVAVLGEGESALRARLTAALAVTPPDQNSMERREQLSQRSLELARSIGDDAAIYDGLMARMWALQGPDDARERLANANELLAKAERDRARYRIFTAREERCRSFMELGDFVAFDRELAAMEAIASELRLYGPWSSAHRFRISRAIGSGRLDEAMTRIDQHLEAEPKPIDRASEIGIAVLRGLAMFDRGEFAHMLPLLDDFMAISDWVGPATRVATGWFCAEIGETKRAAELLSDLPDPTQLLRDENWLITMHFAGLACSEIGEGPMAELYTQLLPYAERNVAQQRGRIYVGSASFSLGRLAASLGRFDEAHAHFATAISHNEALGTRPTLARSHEAWARLLQMQGENERAGQQRQHAAALAREMGMAGLLERIGDPAPG